MYIIAFIIFLEPLNPFRFPSTASKDKIIFGPV
jgi:hypothetical protein